MMASSAGKPPQAGPEAPGDLYVREMAPASFYGEQQPALAVNGHARPVGKPPLPPKAKRERVSDSELSDVSEGDQGSDYELGQAAESDLSDASFDRKRKRDIDSDGLRKRQKTPEDNEMRRKLRGNTPVDDSSRQPSANGASEMEGLEEEEEEEDPTAVPSRIVTPEEEESQKAALKTSWEMVSILDFLAIFQPYLKLDHLQFSAEELASALVLSNGTSGILPVLHIGLMKGISSRSSVNSSSWATSLAEKFKAHWRIGGLMGNPPFVSQRRHEAATYATLPLENRVTSLRLLCELRLDREDLHNVVEHALHPPRKTKAERRAIQMAAKAGKPLPPEPILPTMADMRREPLAKDSSGLLYWFLDYHSTTGTRLYREVPENLLKGKAKKGQSEPQWELLASTPEDLTDLGEKLKRSKKKPDQKLANIFLDDIVPELLERREADLRKQRAAAKIQSQLNNILPDEEGGYGGRSRRNRKTVNYSFDAYDAAIRAALRGSGREEPEGRATRSQAFLEPRMTAEEEALIGLRRGRSAHGTEPSVEPPANRRLRGSSAAPSSDVTPLTTAEPTPEPSVTPSIEPLADPSAGPSINDSIAPSDDEEPSAQGNGANGMSDGTEQPSSQPTPLMDTYDPMSATDQESAEVEISELDSNGEFGGNASFGGDGEEISSLSGGRDASPEFQDDSNDENWR